MGSRTSKKSVTGKDEQKKTPSVGGPTAESLAGMRQSLTITVGDTPMTDVKRIFTSGKIGYYIGGKVVIDGVKCQVGCNIVAVNSDKV